MSKIEIKTAICECCGKEVFEEDLNEADAWFEGNWYELVCDECWETIFDEAVVK